MTSQGRAASGLESAQKDPRAVGAVILGGAHGSLAVARSLGRRGVRPLPTKSFTRVAGEAGDRVIVIDVNDGNAAPPEAARHGEASMRAAQDDGADGARIFQRVVNAGDSALFRCH